MNTQTPTKQDFPSAACLLGGDQVPETANAQGHRPDNIESDGGADSFPENIEALVADYLIYQASRSGFGEITIYTTRSRLKFDELAVCYFSVRPDGQRTLITANNIKDAADELCKWAERNSPEIVRARRMAALERELAELKGEGVAVS